VLEWIRDVLGTAVGAQVLASVLGALGALLRSCWVSLNEADGGAEADGRGTG
jgi:hypothetical protein